MFKTWVENQTDYVKPLIQPRIQPFQCKQMPAPNRMIEAPQNNNMIRHYYPPIIRPIYCNQQITVQKSKIDILYKN